MPCNNARDTITESGGVELPVGAVADGEVLTRVGDEIIGTTAGGGTDHGALTGLGDDDHTQYQLRSEKDAGDGYVGIETRGVATASIGYDYLSKITTYTVNSSDRGKLILCNTGGGSFAVALLAAATALQGFLVGVKKTSSDSNTVTVNPDSSETVDGALTHVITGQHQTAWYVCDGTNWQILAEAGVPVASSGPPTTTGDAAVAISWLRAGLQSGQLDAFATHPTVFKCVSLIAQHLASVPWKVLSGTDKDPTELLDGPWYRLFNRPNPQMSRNYLKSLTASYMAIWGECFWVLDNGNPASPIIGENEVPLFLWPKAGNQVAEAIDPVTGQLRGWRIGGVRDNIVREYPLHAVRHLPWAQDHGRSIRLVPTTQRCHQANSQEQRRPRNSRSGALIRCSGCAKSSGAARSTRKRGSVEASHGHGRWRFCAPSSHIRKYGSSRENHVARIGC